MSDRDLHDRVIRALADAPYRAESEWLSDLVPATERVDRFARFLARHFYYERLHHLFKYSRALARFTGRRAEEVVRSAAFEAMLPTLVLGSRTSAVDVAALATAHVRSGAGAVPYLDDVLRYEETFMIVESGPRNYSGEDANDNGAAVLEEGTAVIELDHDIVPVLGRLLLDNGTDAPAAERRPTRLLFARTRGGRVTVAVATAPMERLLTLADGSRSVDDLARDVGAEAVVVKQALAGLKELGAIRFSTGS